MIRDLIEDEALLALPQSPKHEVCPDAGLLDKLKKREAVARSRRSRTSKSKTECSWKNVSNACSCRVWHL
jgi:uncharacterized metal-binding protein YceD (DUF177 family)